MVHFPLCKSKCNQYTTSNLITSSSSLNQRLPINYQVIITEVGELLVEDTEPGPAAHVKAVEEVSDPLDASSDELNVLPVHPVSLKKVVLIKPISKELKKSTRF